MKKTIIFTVILCWILSGCSESWLEPKPLSFYAPEAVLGDPSGMETIFSALNHVIRAEYIKGPPFITEGLFSDIAVDGTTDQGGITQNLNVQISASRRMNDYGGSNMMHWYWEEGYGSIKNANTVIAYLDNATFSSEAERNRALAHAYFYRSLWYYRLVNLYGDVPFVGRLYAQPKLDFYSTKREVILAKLQKDMEYAVQWALDGRPRGEVTKGACQHLLTKIYLASGEFDKAIAMSTQLINGGVYELMMEPFGEFINDHPDFWNITRNVIWDLHRTENKAKGENREVLFMVLSREDLASSRVDSDIAYNILPFWSQGGANQIYCPDGSGGGMRDDRPTPENGITIPIVEIYGRGVAKFRSTPYTTKKIWDDPKDLRHSREVGNWVEMEDLVFNNPEMSNLDYLGTHLQLYRNDGSLATRDTIRSWYGWPHYKAYCTAPRQAKPVGGPIDMYIFRLAETYLLRAEAYLWKGQPDMAMADINKVRTRAKCDAYTDAGKIDMLVLLAERARELFFEEPRKTELNRISFIFAQTGKPSPYDGKVYSLANLSDDNFWYDHIMATTDFYNRTPLVQTVFGSVFTMSPFHILYPVWTNEITGNTLGVINQNKGYDGYSNNVPPLESIDPEEDT